MPARVSVHGSDDRAHAPRERVDACATTASTARDSRVETHYFHCASPCTLDVPAGAGDGRRAARLRPPALWRPASSSRPGSRAKSWSSSKSNALPAAFGSWISADLHVHMNYGGHYRNTPQNLARGRPQAEDLDVVYNLIVNKEERIPDIAYFRPGADPASDNVRLAHARAGIPHELLGPPGPAQPADHLLLPDFSALSAHGACEPVSAQRRDRRPRARAGRAGRLRASLRLRDRPGEGEVAHVPAAGRRRARQGGLHRSRRLLRPQASTAAVWYRLLNLGFRAAGGRGHRRDGELRLAARPRRA